MLLLLAACVPPTVYGLRFDGTMPANTELSAGGAVFPDMADDSAGTTLADATVVGLEGRQRLGNDVGVAIVAGTAPALFDSGDVPFVGGLELQGRILQQRPVTVALLGGLDGYVDFDAPSLTSGVHLGAVVSRGLPLNLRPYLGVQVNPVIVELQMYPWFLYSTGLSWRPTVTTSTRGLVLLEGTVYQGIGTSFSGTTTLASGTVMGPVPEDILTWGLLLQVGASFGSDAE
jgi:hypothetical protein